MRVLLFFLIGIATNCIAAKFLPCNNFEEFAGRTFYQLGTIFIIKAMSDY